MKKEPESFFEAALQGNLQTIESALADGVDPNARRASGSTALMYAAHAGHVEIVDRLLARGADPDLKDENGYTALMIASKAGREEIVTKLIAARSDLNARAEHDLTPLILACQGGQAGVVKLLLDNGADVNAAAAGGASPLLFSAARGPEEIAALLLQHGAQVNAAETERGYTPLIVAAASGRASLLRLLLAHGADTNAKTTGGQDAMAVAAAGDHEDIMALLADAQKNQPAPSPERLREKNGEALVNLCAFGDSALDDARALMEQGANLEARNPAGLTPLVMAASNGSIEMARALIEHGADVNAEAETGEAPLYWACFAGHPAVAQLLLEKGARLTPKAWEAAQNSGNEMIDVLMAAAAKRSGGTEPHIPCDCDMRTRTTRPSDAEAQGTFTIVHKNVHEGGSETFGLCNDCRRRWKVTEDLGYHYPTYSWEELKEPGQLAHEFEEAEAKVQPRNLPFSQYQSKRGNMVALVLQDPKAAKKAAEVVLFFDPDDALAWLILGMACDSTGDAARAQEIVSSVAKKAFGEKQIAEVKEFLQQLLRHSEHGLLRYGTEFAKPWTGDDPDELFAAAVARGAGGDAPGARELLQRVVALKPDHFDAWYNLGLSNLETGQPQEAISCFERSLSISPDNHPVLYQLAVAREDTGDVSGALKTYEDAERTRPTWGGQRDCSEQIKDALARLRDPEGYLKGGHARTVESVAFSADGKKLASGSLDRTIRVWEADTGKPLMRLGGNANSLECVAFSSDGKYLASRECLSSVYSLWSLPAARRVKSWSGGSGSVWEIAFSPDSRLLAVEADTTAVALVSLETRLETKRMTGHTDEIKCLAFHPDGKLLASGSRDLTVRLWEVATVREVQRLEGHSKVLGSVAFSPDGRLVATGAYDSLLLVREVDGGKVVRSIQLAGSRPVRNIRFSRDSRRVHFGASSEVLTCDLESGEVKALVPDLGVVNSRAVSPDERLLATGYSDYQDQRLHVWDVATQREMWKS